MASKVNNIENEYYLLENDFFILLNDLVDFMYNNQLVPRKMLLFKDYVKSYINNNKIFILKSALDELLTIKDDILNFDFDNLNEIDDFDNFTVKINKNKKDNNNEFIDMIIELKDRAIKLDKKSRKILKELMSVIILILEQISDLF